MHGASNKMAGDKINYKHLLIKWVCINILSKSSVPRPVSYPVTFVQTPKAMAWTNLCLDPRYKAARREPLFLFLIFSAEKISKIFSNPSRKASSCFTTAHKNLRSTIFVRGEGFGHKSILLQSSKIARDPDS